jgi:hypothetical protein
VLKTQEVPPAGFPIVNSRHCHRTFRNFRSALIGRSAEEGKPRTRSAILLVLPVPTVANFLSVGFQFFKYCTIAVVITSVRFVEGAPLRFQAFTNRSNDFRSFSSSRIGVRRFVIQGFQYRLSSYTSIYTCSLVIVNPSRPTTREPVPMPLV